MMNCKGDSERMPLENSPQVVNDEGVSMLDTPALNHTHICSFIKVDPNRNTVAQPQFNLPSQQDLADPQRTVDRPSKGGVAH